MTHYMKALAAMSTRSWGFVFAGISLAILASVFISQYGFGMHPCKLCLYQRYPYGLSLFLGLALALFANHPKAAHVFLWLLVLTFLASFALAVFHVGVEYKWWTFDSECSNSNLFKPGASYEEIKAALQTAATVRCDDRIVFLFGMTMAFYNALASAGLVLLALFASRAQRSSSLSQYK